VTAKRHLRGSEKALVQQLLRQTDQKVASPDTLDTVEVQEMSDGGMGSLYFVHRTKDAESRRFGKRVAELQFKDADGITIVASLNVDTDGDLFELDIWKTDFSSVMSLEFKRT
jgi:hypothetical protein